MKFSALSQDAEFGVAVFTIELLCLSIGKVLMEKNICFRLHEISQRSCSGMLSITCFVTCIGPSWEQLRQPTVSSHS